MPIPYLWERLTCNEPAAAALAEALKISPVIARLLAMRGMTYDTSAHLVSPQGDITAAKIGLTFAADTQDVKNLEAAGTVTLKENGRVTTGDKLLYVSEGEAYTMTGKLVKMIEANCRESTGTTLNFERSTDKLRIDGSDDSRVQSNKTAPGCVPRQN